MGRLKVVLADDQPLILAGISGVLEESGDIDVVGQAGTGQEAIALVERTKPDVAVIGMRLRQPDGLSCLNLITTRHPQVKVVMLGDSAEPAHIETVLSRGASGYVRKSVNPLDMPAALRQLVDLRASAHNERGIG